MHSSPFSGQLAHCSPLYSSLTKDQNERAGDDADCGGSTCARAAGWPCARQACMPNILRHTAATPDLPTSLPFCSCAPLYIV